MKEKESQDSRLQAWLKQIQEAWRALSNLGAHRIDDRTIYVPGNVNMRQPMAVDSYGEMIAARIGGHKAYLRKNFLGKFRKGK